MQVLDFSTSHSRVVDEQLTVASSSATKLLHDVFYNKTGKKVVIATAPSGGGTVLTETTDYTVGTAYPGVYGLDSTGTPVSIAPDTGYTTIAITNATYHNTTLYVSYYPIVDLMSASRFNTEIPVQFLSATDNYTIISKLNNICLNFTRQAAGKTVTLPDATTNSGQTITINVSGTGAGDVTLAGTGTQTINGLAIGSWAFKGTGKLKIVSDGANYKTDADYVWDTYTNPSDSKQEVSEYTNGLVEINGWCFKLGTASTTITQEVTLPFTPDLNKHFNAGGTFIGRKTNSPSSNSDIDYAQPQDCPSNIFALSRASSSLKIFGYNSANFTTQYYLWNYKLRYYKA